MSKTGKDYIAYKDVLEALPDVLILQGAEKFNRYKDLEDTTEEILGTNGKVADLTDDERARLQEHFIEQLVSLRELQDWQDSIARVSAACKLVRQYGDFDEVHEALQKVQDERLKTAANLVGGLLNVEVEVQQ